MSFVGSGGRPSAITVLTPVETDGGSSSEGKPRGGRAGPVTRRGSTGRWNPIAPPEASVNDR